MVAGAWGFGSRGKHGSVGMVAGGGRAPALTSDETNLVSFPEQGSLWFVAAAIFLPLLPFGFTEN